MEGERLREQQVTGAEIAAAAEIEFGSRERGSRGQAKVMQAKDLALFLLKPRRSAQDGCPEFDPEVLCDLRQPNSDLGIGLLPR